MWKRNTIEHTLIPNLDLNCSILMGFLTYVQEILAQYCLWSRRQKLSIMMPLLWKQGCAFNQLVNQLNLYCVGEEKDFLARQYYAQLEVFPPGIFNKPEKGRIH